ncbi:carboxypeptidase-like regulatory domain-containing protein [Chitinophaga fulva]|uniref:carboxypeptidase-like regulatory domain-containing protein n=1 Tax=Chitinophaga fulva TaxID=2728842 RepID=UPI00197D51AA|nr:carboxypeptidase-like regulatory domain-containing protein [Chitinophaga fulva]
MSVRGFVKGSSGAPVAGAAVSVVTENGAGLVFGQSDTKGFFDCKFESSKEKVFIKITAMGYFPATVPIAVTVTEAYNVTLNKRPTELPEVTVKSNKKISLSSDTLKYNVNAFKDKNDRVIGDLIGRLPGIQIDEKGAISYNGKPITNVYIDGNNILDGRYRIATDNVPVDAVTQVQVIERDQPIKALNGYVVANNTSLNLQLAKAAKATFVNNAVAGAGNESYVGELSSLMFKRKILSINTLKTNNTGKNLLNENEEVGVSFDNNEATLKKSQSYLSMGSETAPAMMDEKYYLKNNDNAINTHTLFKLKQDWGLRINIAGLQLKRKYGTDISTSYFFPGADTISYDEKQDNIYQLHQWQIGAQLEKNSKSAYVKSISRLDIPKWDRTGATIQNGQMLNQRQPTKNTSISNETVLIKALGTQNILQYSSILQYYTANENLTVLPGVHKDIINDSIDYIKLDQQVHSTNTYIDQSVTFKTKLSQWVFSVSAGLSYHANRLQTDLYKTDSSYAATAAGPSFKNDIAFHTRMLYGKLSAIYPLKKGSFTIATTPGYCRVDYTLPTGAAIEKSYFLLNPLAQFTTKTGRYGEVSARYAQQAMPGQVSDIYTGSILENYRSFNANTTPLPKTDMNSYSFRYSYRQPLQILFYYINLSYNRTRQNYIKAYTLDSGITRSTAMDFKNIADGYTLGSGVSKYIFGIAASVSANGSAGLQKGNNYYNNAILAYHAYNASLSVSAEKKLFQKGTLSLTGEKRLFINEQGKGNKAESKNRTALTRLNAKWRQQLNDRLSYNASYQLVAYHQSGWQPVNSHFLDAEIRYALPKQKSYFEFQCTNLLNQRLYTQVSTTAGQVSTAVVPLRQRTFLLRYVFTF